MSQKYFAKNGKQKRQRKQRERNILIYELKRKAANERERKRMYSINEAFDKLRHLLPRLSNDRKISKASTLREAIRYIKQLSQLLNDDELSHQENPISSYTGIIKTENERSTLIIPNSDDRLPMKFVELSCSKIANDYDSIIKTEYGTVQGRCSKVWIPDTCEAVKNSNNYDQQYLIDE